ncbi:MAG: DMT family transporter [Bacillota bacterium]
MFESHIGQLAALGTAVCWTLTGVAFESAGKKIGSLAVNILRLLVAFLLLSIYNYFTRGLALPVDATASNWTWLFLSGMIGFVIGDLFLFQAYVEIGSRISLLIMSAVPPITSIVGYLVLGETISPKSFAGMFITIAGIAIVILSRGAGEKKVEFNRPVRGLTFAFLGALGQAFGLVFSKLGMGDYNPFASTQIRIVAAVIGFSLIITLSKKWGAVIKGAKNVSGMRDLSIGAFFGPFVGVSLSLMAVKYAPTGVVSTITSISPILIIPASIVIFKEKVLVKEILGAVISIIGVTLLFL